MKIFFLAALWALSCGCQADSAITAPPSSGSDIPVFAAPPVSATDITTPDAPPLDDPGPEATDDPGPEPVDEPGQTPTDEPWQTPQDEPWPEPADEPGQAGEDEGAEENTPESVYTGPDLVECEAVDDEYFADAAFFGNSLVDGLSWFGGLRRGSFFAVTSASVVNVDTTCSFDPGDGEKITLLQALTGERYGKIYILLGINEISFEPDYFCQLYGALLDRIWEAEPGADIYIMALSPVTEECSENSEFFNMERIRLYNEALYALAREKRCYFVDLCQALAGEDGYLPAEESTDGIHLTAEKYPQWADYLRTHVKQ